MAGGAIEAICGRHPTISSSGRGGAAPLISTFSLRFAQGERGAERLVPALRSATGEPGTRDGSPFGGPLSAALALAREIGKCFNPTNLFSGSVASFCRSLQGVLLRNKLHQTRKSTTV